jgi:hypothetical protein
VSTGNSKSAPKPSPAGSAKPSAHDARTPPDRTGRVKFDDRGNAVWEWSIATGAFGQEVTTARIEKLEHPSLAIAEEAPISSETVKANPLGTKKGYDPYDSGKLAKAGAPRKKDLRKLSEWLKLRKQAKSNKEEEG